MKLAALLLLAATPAAAAPWTVDPARSQLGFQATWTGKTVTGSFARWTAAIDFDPAKPAVARIGATVDLGSARTGDGTVDGALPGADFFAGGQARFTGAGITQTAPGRYLMRGTLAMRGASVPVALPFTLAIAGNTATATGTARVDRRAWKIGVQSDATGQWVSFPVAITLKLVATRR